MKSLLVFDYLAIQPTAFSPYHGGGKYGKIILLELLCKTENILLAYSSLLSCNGLFELKEKHPGIILFDISKKNAKDIFLHHYVSCIYFPIPFSKLYKQIKKNIPKNVNIIATIHGLRDTEVSINLETFRYKTTLKQNIRRIKDFLLKPLKIYLWKKLIRQNNYHYFVVSNHTKNTVKKILPKEDPKVFYSPSVIEKLNISDVQKLKYFLLVSGNRFEKNNLMAIETLDDMFTKNELPAFFSVKITGIKSLEQYHAKISNTQKFECLGYVDEEKFTDLYKYAYALIYPSLSEGFGYPLLEAMNAHTPIIASKLTSIPEVAGNAALYFNPYKKAELKEQIIQITKVDVYNDLILKGFSQFSRIFEKQKKDLDRTINYILLYNND